MFKSLDSFQALRKLLMRLRHAYYTKAWGMDIHPTVQFSTSVRLDKTNPRGVHVGAQTYLAFECCILTHDMTRRMSVGTWIGERCFIGARSTILPGVRIGDECIVAAGAVVTRDVPPRSVVAGNPAVVIREGIEVGPYGVLKNRTPIRTDQ